jgi:heptosyltransferase-2
VAPGAVHAAKRWPAERFAEAADALVSGDGTVLILGSRADRAAAQAVAGALKSRSVNLAGETSLRELFSLLAGCRVVLTNDSGIMHAADAVFGPTVEAFGFFPAGSRSTVVQAEGLACRPCHIHGPESCPLGHFRCMKDVTGESVVLAARRVTRV